MTFRTRLGLQLLESRDNPSDLLGSEDPIEPVQPTDPVDPGPEEPFPYGDPLDPPA